MIEHEVLSDVWNMTYGLFMEIAEDKTPVVEREE